MKSNALLYVLFAVTAVSALLALDRVVPRPSAQRALRLMLAALLASPVANAATAIYHCDLDGRTSFQDTPCEFEATTLRVMPILKPPSPENIAAEPATETVAPASNLPSGVQALPPKRGSQPVSATAIDSKPRIERVEPTAFNRDQRTTEVRRASAECQGILDQIAVQKELMHSLRADSRAQARNRVGELSRDLRTRC